RRQATAVGHRRPALALDGERARARRRGRREPGIAHALVLDEKRRGEDVAGTGRVRLRRGSRPHLVAVAVDEEQRAVAVGGEDTEGDVLEPFDHGGLMAADVLAREEERLDLVQEWARVVGRGWRVLAAGCDGIASRGKSSAWLVRRPTERPSRWAVIAP